MTPRQIEHQPHSLEAEQAVLGGLLMDGGAWSAVSVLVRADDFYRADHRTIFEAIGQLAATDTPADALTVSEHLDRQGQLINVGGLSYLGALARDTPTAANIRAYAEIVQERSRLRRLRMIGSEIDRAIVDGAAADQIADSLALTLKSLNRRARRAVAAQWLRELEDFAPPDQIVSSLLVAGSLIVIYGESNSGKTFFILDICMALARGVPWRHLRTQRGLVVYVAGEGAASVRARLTAYVTTHPDAAGAPFLLVPTAVDLLDPAQVGALIETIRSAESESGEQTALLVFDTLARAMAGGDESSTQDMGMVVAAADRIRAEIGCAVVFIHHAGKDPTKGARGSSALRAACDTELLVDGQSGPRTVTVTKQRDLGYGEPMAFELKPVVIGQDPDSGDDVTSCVITHTVHEPAPKAATPAFRGQAQKQLLSALRARSKDDPSQIWTITELRKICKDMGMAKSTAVTAVDTLAASPYMQTTIGGYKFTDGGAE